MQLAEHGRWEGGSLGGTGGGGTTVKQNPRYELPYLALYYIRGSITDARKTLIFWFALQACREESLKGAVK